MRNYLLYITFIVFALTFSSCEKEETPVTLPPASGVLVNNVHLGTNYTMQVFVDLDAGITGSFPNDAWDLAFDCGSDQTIQLNGGNYALIAFANSTSFSAIADYTALKWYWDEACGLKDSLALTNWQHKHDSVFIIDRGMQYKDPERYFQFKLEMEDASSYKIIVADASGKNSKEHIILKDANKRFVYFSFANGGQYKNTEPDKTNWDLCFLAYRWIYYEFTPPLLYRVTGAYINNEYISVASDSVNAVYNKVEAVDFAGKNFSGERDAIGYDWKVPIFSGANVTYRTRDYMVYFIRKKQAREADKLYKLHFIDFYDDKGNKGSPAFEMKRLQ